MYDDAIVGYGPVGQTLAILLGQQGWKVGVFEKQPVPYPLPRAVHFDREVARILQAAGLGEELPRLTEPADTYEWRNAAGETLLVIVVPRERRVWTPINWQLCDPARPTTVVSGGPGRRRWEFMRLPGESVADLNSEATAWRLLAPWGMTPDTASLERHALYTFQARWVDQWRKGRCLLAGDAAHQMPPFAGQGMCAGVRDAANLAWKLDLVLGGLAPDTLLDTYASERVAQVRQVVAFSIELGRVICVADPAEAAARDAALMAAVKERGPTPPLPTPAIGPGLLVDGDPLAGHLFPQGEVRP